MRLNYWQDIDPLQIRVVRPGQPSTPTTLRSVMKTTADTAGDLMTGKADNLEESLVIISAQMCSFKQCSKLYFIDLFATFY